MAGQPLLSIVIVGRNDDYLGNYRYRLQTSLNHLAKNLRSLGRLKDVEIVFVDWNSQGKTLADEVELTAEAASLLRFILVPPAAAMRRNSQVSFFTTCAVNVGVRRAKGEFIMLADSDSMMPLPSLDALLKVLDGTRATVGSRDKLIFPIPRHQIPGAIGARKLNVAAWDIVLQRIFSARRKELPSADCLGGFSAGQLMHRDLWFEFGGYNENLDRAWGWSDNELMFRVSRTYNWMDLGYFGVVAFHIEHHASTGNAHQRDPNSINAMLLTFEPHPNGPDWGMRDETLSERGCSGRVTLSADPDWGSLSYQISANTHIRGSVVDDYINWTGLMHPAELPFDTATREAIGIAFVFGQHDRPLNAYFFGQVRLPVMTILTHVQPGISYYFLNPWKEGDLANARTLPATLGSHLAAHQHRGFSRLLIGPAVSGLDALAASDPHAGPIELAVFDRESFEEDFEITFNSVLQRLAPGGAIILIDSRRRAPVDSEEMKVFLGRIIGRAALPTAGDVMSRPFVQITDEATLGAGFDVSWSESGAAHLIRKKPTSVAAPHQIAAE